MAKSKTIVRKLDMDIEPLKDKLKTARRLVTDFQQGNQISLNAGDKKMFEDLQASLSGVEKSLLSINKVANQSTVDEVFKQIGMSAEDLKKTLDVITTSIEKIDLKKLSEQVSNLNKLMEGFGSGVSKNLGEFEKRAESTRSAVAKLQNGMQDAASATGAQVKTEKELQAELSNSKKKAQEYGAELDKLNDKKEQSKVAANALSGIKEEQKIVKLKEYTFLSN